MARILGHAFPDRCRQHLTLTDTEQSIALGCSGAERRARSHKPPLSEYPHKDTLWRPGPLRQPG
jgi:hypothetical protein